MVVFTERPFVAGVWGAPSPRQEEEEEDEEDEEEEEEASREDFE